MREIVLDIETIPSQIPSVYEDIMSSAKAEIDALRPPKSYIKKEQIDEWMAKNIQEINENAIKKYERCSFDGALNHIVCIGLHIEGLKPVTFSGEGENAMKDELLLNSEFFNYLDENISQTFEAPIWVGHNIIGFDLKIIKQRSMVLNLQPHACIPFNSKPWDMNPFDTMVRWDNKNSVSLDKISKAFGFEGKGDVSGKDVYPMWKAGKIKEICEYCAEDVSLTRKVYHRMTYQQLKEV